MAVDLKEECDRLAALAPRNGSAQAREQLLAGLGSKWEGVQLAAARVLLEWGDRESLEAVKALLVDVAGKDRRQGATHQLARGLAPRLGEDDLAWVIDVYFGSSRRTNRTALGALFERLPMRATLEAIERRKQVDNVDPRDEKLAVAEMQRVTVLRR